MEDAYALPVIRGRARQLEPRVNPDSTRDMIRWRARIERSKRPLCVSLWSGAGGLDLGLEQAGYDVVVAADHDDWACQTHGYNGDALVCCRDLDDPEATKAWLRSLDLPHVVLVAGGFPCQPYSRAGHSRIRQLVAAERRPRVDQRTFAWLSFVAAIEELRPERALAENVPDLARYDDGQQMRDIVRAIERLGYEVDVRVLPARAYGVPQFRERLIIQAARTGHAIVWPEPHADVDDTLLTAIGDLPEIAGGHQDDLMPYKPRREAPAWARDGVTAANADLQFDHIVRDVRDDDLRAFEQLPPGGTYLDIPAELRRYDDEHFTDKYKRLEWDRPSRTITAHIARDGYWYIHPEQHRTLSLREAARVQTFPDWFRFAGFPSNRLTQIGNAVPPMLGKALGRAVLDADEGLVTPSPVPAAARRLRETADELWSKLDAWEILVREAVFSGRAGEDRVASFLAELPEPTVAARVRRPANDHVRKARSLARALVRNNGELPDDPSEAARITGLPATVARLIVAQVHGGEPPRSGGTVRVAERVSGVRRIGSLNGVSQVVLARLADFGEFPAVNQLLVDIGRAVCVAELPRCGQCPLAPVCAYGQERGVEQDQRREPAALF